MRHNLSLVKIYIAGSIISVLFTGTVYASPTDGTIDSTFKYAWSDNVGWINFNTAGSNIRITDTQLSGYAWSKNNGWINLRPSNSGVANNREGTLSGSAWGDQLGWINFSGVTINTTGRFRGQATGDTIGTLTFDCVHCDVRTDWRPASARGASVTNAPTSASAGNGVGVPSSPERLRLAPVKPVLPRAIVTIVPLPAVGIPIPQAPAHIPVIPQQSGISAPPQALFDIGIQLAAQAEKNIYIIVLIAGFILSLTILIYWIHRMRIRKKIEAVTRIHATPKL